MFWQASSHFVQRARDFCRVWMETCFPRSVPVSTLTRKTPKKARKEKGWLKLSANAWPNLCHAWTCQNTNFSPLSFILIPTLAATIENVKRLFLRWRGKGSTDVLSKTTFKMFPLVNWVILSWASKTLVPLEQKFTTSKMCTTHSTLTLSSS